MIGATGATIIWGRITVVFLDGDLDFAAVKDGRHALAALSEVVARSPADAPKPFGTVQRASRRIILGDFQVNDFGSGQSGLANRATKQGPTQSTEAASWPYSQSEYLAVLENRAREHEAE